MIFMVWRNETESKALKFKGTKMIPIDLAQKKLSEKKKKSNVSIRKIELLGSLGSHKHLFHMN